MTLGHIRLLPAIYMPVVQRNDSVVWPGWRLCQKVGFDAETGRIYLLGCIDWQNLMH